MAKHQRETAGPSQRQLRVGEEIRHTISDLLLRGEFRDPELQGHSITVTEVRVSPDLKNATAFVTPLGGRDAEIVVRALNRAAPFVRGQVARTVRLKFAPAIEFRLDTSFTNAEHIEKLLRRPDIATDLTPDPDEDSDGA